MTQFCKHKIRDFGFHIERVIKGFDLTQEQTRDMFQQILLNEQPELQQGAFLAALRAKGETPNEIVGAWEAIRQLDTHCVSVSDGEPLVENSGTGMDGLKTFNVSTAAAIVAASCGVRMARHGSRGLTSTCGTVDVLEALGLDVECPVQTVMDSISSIGIGLFNGMSQAVHPGALGRILSQIRFGSTLNIAASLASPCRPTHGLRGVHRLEAMEQVGRVMHSIGYRRALIVHGFDAERALGMDELSNLGESEWLEVLEDGQSSRGTMSPESLGLRRATYEEIQSTGDPQREASRLFEVIAGTNHDACQDLVCLNAAAILYLVGRASTIGQAIPLAREQLGVPALGTLVNWSQAQATDATCARAAISKLRQVAAQVGQSSLLEGVIGRVDAA